MIKYRLISLKLGNATLGIKGKLVVIRSNYYRFDSKPSSAVSVVNNMNSKSSSHQKSLRELTNDPSSHYVSEDVDDPLRDIENDM